MFHQDDIGEIQVRRERDRVGILPQRAGGCGFGEGKLQLTRRDRFDRLRRAGARKLQRHLEILDPLVGEVRQDQCCPRFGVVEPGLDYRVGQFDEPGRLGALGTNFASLAYEIAGHVAV